MAHGSPAAKALCASAVTQVWTLALLILLAGAVAPMAWLEGVSAHSAGEKVQDVKLPQLLLPQSDPAAFLEFVRSHGSCDPGD